MNKTTEAIEAARRGELVETGTPEKTLAELNSDDDIKRRAIHGPLYGCSDVNCREHYSWQPEHLTWHDAGVCKEFYMEWDAGWYCPNCAELGYIDLAISPPGITLDKFLEETE